MPVELVVGAITVPQYADSAIPHISEVASMTQERQEDDFPASDSHEVDIIQGHSFVDFVDTCRSP